MPVSPEAFLLSAVVKTGEYKLLLAEGVTPDLFHVFRDEAEWILQYIIRNQRAPSRIDVKQAFPDFVTYRGADNVAHWIGEVKQSHKAAALLDATQRAMDLIDNDDPDAAIEHIHQSALRIAQETAGVTGSIDALSDWKPIFDDVKRRQAIARVNGGIAGVPTGFPTLDAVTGGLQPGWLTIIAARLGNGKTWSGVKMAFSASLAGKKVIYFSLEQPRNQIAMRVHAFGSRRFANKPLNPMDLARGMNVNLAEYKAFLRDMEANKGTGSLLVNDTSRGRLTPSSIGGIIETEQPDLVVIDYLTLLASSGDDWRGAAKLVGDVQQLAHSYRLPVVALAQINRNGAGGKEPPGTESLYSSDSIGMDADLVVTQMQRSETVMMHKIAKFRHGPAGKKWYTRFNPAEGVYDEITGDEAHKFIQDDLDNEED